MSDTVTVREIMCTHGVSRAAVMGRITAGTLPATIDPGSARTRIRIRREDAATLTFCGWWTPEEDERLEAMLRTHDLTAIAHALGRSVSGVQMRMRRLHLTTRDGGGQHYTATAAADVLGTTHTTVLRWVRCGVLRSLRVRPATGANRCVLIAAEEIERFVRAHANPPRKASQWRWQQMPPGYLRNIAKAIERTAA